MSEPNEKRAARGNGEAERPTRRTARNRPVVVHPPRLVPLGEKDEQQALAALRALLVPYFRQQRTRQAGQQQPLTTPRRPSPPHLNDDPGEQHDDRG